jgi:hypothetical protein
MKPSNPSNADFARLAADPPARDQSDTREGERDERRVRELMNEAKAALERRPVSPGLVDRVRAGFLHRVEDHTLPPGTSWFEDLNRADDADPATEALRNIINRYEPVVRRDLAVEYDPSPELADAVVSELWEILWRKRAHWPGGQAGLDRLFKRAGQLAQTYSQRLQPKLTPVESGPERTAEPFQEPADPAASDGAEAMLFECLRKHFTELSGGELDFLRGLVAVGQDAVRVTSTLCTRLGMAPKEVRKRLRSLLVRVGGKLSSPSPCAK